MKVVLTFFLLIISGCLFAQDNSGGKKNQTTAAVPAGHGSDIKNGKKVHYVEKRTKPVQNSSKINSGSQTQKKPVISKAENPKNMLTK